jgi:hypothetical protein
MTPPALLLSAFIATASPNQIDWRHPSGNPVQLVDGGLCVGLAWIKLLPGEIATVDYGPDFNVYRVKGPGEAQWGAYSGFAAQAGPDREHPLLTKSGATVYRGTSGAGFDGYFLEEVRSSVVMERRPDGSVASENISFTSQNHFFGTIFKDAPSDEAFFDRVTFGSSARAKCEGPAAR